MRVTVTCPDVKLTSSWPLSVKLRSLDINLPSLSHVEKYPVGVNTPLLQEPCKNTALEIGGGERLDNGQGEAGLLLKK